MIIKPLRGMFKGMFKGMYAPSDSSVSAGGAYDPSTDDSIVHWYKSDWSGACLDAGAAQCDDGEECATWVASKGGANATYVGSDGPLFQTNYQNGLGVLEGITGGYCAMRTAEQSSISQPFTFWLVFKVTSNAATCVPIYSYDASPQAYLRYYGPDTAMQGFAASAIQMFVMNNTNMHILRVTFNGASSTHQLDGGASTAFGSTPGANAYVGITLFNFDTRDYVGNVALGEVLIQNKAPSAGEDTSIRGYLNTKWAVY